MERKSPCTNDSIGPLRARRLLLGLQTTTSTSLVSEIDTLTVYADRNTAYRRTVSALFCGLGGLIVETVPAVKLCGRGCAEIRIPRRGHAV